MGQHRLTRDVADRENAPHGGPTAIVNADERAVHVEIDVFEPPAAGRRAATDGDEDLVGRQRASCPSACLDQSRRRASEPLRLRAGQHLDAKLAQTLGNRPGQLSVILRQDPRLRLDDRYPGSHLGEGGAEFEPDIAGADDHKTCPAPRDSASAPVDEMTGPPNGRNGSSTGSEPGGDHDLLRPDDLGPKFGLHLHGLAVAESRPADDDLDARLFQQARRRRCSGARRCRPSRRRSGEVERRRLGGNPERAPACGHMQDRCRIPPPRGSAPWRECSRH